MHFPRFVLKSFIIGAALCFPTVALADKTDHVQSSKINQTAMVHKQVNAKNINKSKAHLKNETHKVDQNESHKSKPLLKEAKKIVKNVKKPVLGKLKQERKFVKETNPGKKKGLFKTNKVTSTNQKKQTTHVETSKLDVSEKSLPTIIPDRRKMVSNTNNTDSVIHFTKQDSKKSEKSYTNKVPSPNKPKPKKTKRVPADSNKDSPQDMQVITTTTLGSNYSTGISKDRTNVGQNPLNYTVWFEWNKYRSLTFSQSYISRSYELCNQWTNAPPFQPPK